MFPLYAYYFPEFYSRSESQVTQFQDFLKRANRYPALQLDGEGAGTNKVVLVEVSPD